MSLELRGRKFANRNVLSRLVGEIKENREMEIIAMERLIAAKVAESNEEYEILNATKEWNIVGEGEDEKEQEIEAMERLIAARAAQKKAHTRDLENLNATQQWKLHKKPFS